MLVILMACAAWLLAAGPRGAEPSPSAAAPAANGPVSPSADAGDHDVAVEASPPTRLVIEAAEISVPILPLLPSEEALADQAIVPPMTEDGYWLATYGQPGEGSSNTTYLTGHSWDGREAPFNRLSTHSSVGDAITLETEAGSLKYVVDSITTHDKDTLKDSDIWQIIPNRLVIISCYTEDLWGKNVIVTASPVS
ncbi:class F sortase [Arthrobacter sp. zg-Y877]|uniref:class F sortase n=1 Tax=Arthrobacter sp. zg-Y877 TaxID=3049074 RepID=UPI0025A479D6|nr:class F sortase [Arthrobacter sp. zg-Y877]MDM7989008.1 class F sortase [Arthrobacter sp. zg-Y877]